MPRTNRIASHEFPINISGRCINKDWFEQPMEKVWPVFTDHLYFCAKAYDVEIHSFVLMQNHFHLLARFPKDNLSQVMSYFMRETSRAITKNAGRINQMYGGRFHSSLITKENHYRNVYKYNYRNPVKAGVSDRAEKYEYSTLSGLLGFSKLDIPVAEDQILFENPEQVLEWINKNPGQIHEYELKQAMRRSTMAFSLDRKNRNQAYLEHGLL